MAFEVSVISEGLIVSLLPTTYTSIVLRRLQQQELQIEQLFHLINQ